MEEVVAPATPALDVLEFRFLVLFVLLVLLV